MKTVIASQASAKVSCRLVHKQDPEKIRQALRDYVRSSIPADCTVEFKNYGSSPALQLSEDSSFIKEAKDALSQEWEVPAVLTAMGVDSNCCRFSVNSWYGNSFGWFWIG